MGKVKLINQLPSTTNFKKCERKHFERTLISVMVCKFFFGGGLLEQWQSPVKKHLPFGAV
jgi:hypothetical protein